MHDDNILILRPEPVLHVSAELRQHGKSWRAVVRTWEVHRLRRREAVGAVGLLTAEVVDPVILAVFLAQELHDVAVRISEGRLQAFGGKAHGNDPACHVCEVQIEAPKVVAVPPPRARPPQGTEEPSAPDGRPPRRWQGRFLPTPSRKGTGGCVARVLFGLELVVVEVAARLLDDPPLRLAVTQGVGAVALRAGRAVARWGGGRAEGVREIAKPRQLQSVQRPHRRQLRPRRLRAEPPPAAARDCRRRRRGGRCGRTGRVR
mmetsp:Transcript_35229/g.114051  ORF Transcript_35229/g.114051 Transcript_35229/m.114051 type:complete len:261 (+) Transcript_35229:956-1738(+)